MEKPVVEMDGDEMTRIIWQFIKEKVPTPLGGWRVGGQCPKVFHGSLVDNGPLFPLSAPPSSC